MHHWHVLGFGAIGQLFAHQALQSGNKVTAIPSSQHDTHTATTDFIFEDIQGETFFHTINTLNLNNEQAIEGAIKHLIICTKAQQTLSAVQLISDFIDDSTVIVMLQNGMGAHEEVQQFFLTCHIKPSIYLATTTHGVLRITPRHSKHTGLGETYYGHWLNGETDEHILPIFTYQRHILNRLWEKLIINCAINALTVKYNCLNGELLNIEGARHDMLKILKESCVIALAVASEHFNVKDTDKLSNIFLKRVNQVLMATANNSSSMREDVRH
ncbi:MAG: 2-dehydropantoate 2-reductase, partial [Sinobacterium sp.]|nr:2-dehydropantoate 2-reductase [Sinobacterium sp.]